MGNKSNHLFLHDLKKNRTMWIMILPTLLFFVLFAYFPMVGVYNAFTSYDYSKGLFRSPFIGFANFKFLFAGGQNSIIWQLTRNTVLYNLAFIFIGNFVEMLTAIILSELVGKAYKRITQSIMFLPYFISYVIVGVFIYSMLNYEYGLASNIANSLGRSPFDFYGTPAAWPIIIILAYLWKWIGYGMVIYLAAIMNMDRSVFEAADVDGANVFQRIRNITIPMLMPTFIILLLLSLGGIMRGQFDLFYQIVGNNGTLFNVTNIIDTYVFRTLTVNPNIGLGTAAGLYQSLFGMVVVLVVNFIVKKVNTDYALF